MMGLIKALAGLGAVTLVTAGVPVIFMSGAADWYAMGFGPVLVVGLVMCLGASLLHALGRGLASSRHARVMPHVAIEVARPAASRRRKWRQRRPGQGS